MAVRIRKRGDDQETAVAEILQVQDSCPETLKKASKCVRSERRKQGISIRRYMGLISWTDFCR